MSIMLCLSKVVYLCRVFSQMNFLVTMLMTVISEVMYFMLLFFIFLLFFAQCNQLIGVDVVPYGRCPHLISHVLAMLRCAMGDFAPIDMYQTYDLVKIGNGDL